MRSLCVTVMEIKLEFFVVYFFLFGIFKQRTSVYAQFNGQLNYPCNTIRDCRDFGYVCRDRICQCDQWYIPDDEKKQCVGGVDQKCLYDEHCINGAYCMNQSICKCKHSSSQPLHHGLVCAGASNLNQRSLVRLLLLMTTIVYSIFPRIYHYAI